MIRYTSFVRKHSKISIYKLNSRGNYRENTSELLSCVHLLTFRSVMAVYKMRKNFKAG